MRVLMFGWEFPPANSGGLGVACYGLTRALANEGVHVTFVLPRKAPVKENGSRIVFAGLEPASIDFVRLDTLLTPYVTSENYGRIRSEYGDAPYGGTLIEEVERYGVLAGRLAAQENFDVIHAHDWLSFLAGVKAREVSGKPLVSHIHATEYDRTGGNGENPRVAHIERLGMLEADCVVAVSEYTKRVVANSYGVNPSKVEVIHNGIDLDEFREADGGKVPLLEELKSFGYGIVLFVGRITLQKGPDYFVRMAEQILRHQPKTVFVVGGTGDMKTQMIRQAAYAGISDKFVFANLWGAERDRVYRLADLYVMPSVSEPFGITPLESIMWGTPALISKQSGVSEVLTHALKVDFWDVDQMANKAVAVLRNRSLRNTLAQNGKENVTGITWKKAAEKCKALYESLARA